MRLSAPLLTLALVGAEVQPTRGADRAQWLALQKY